jgi:hypothetical protein
MIFRFSPQPDSSYSQIFRKAGQKKAEPNRSLMKEEDMEKAVPLHLYAAQRRSSQGEWPNIFDHDVSSLSISLNGLTSSTMM